MDTSSWLHVIPCHYNTSGERGHQIYSDLLDADQQWAISILNDQSGALNELLTGLLNQKWLSITISY